jgi:hypothetical protein
MPATAHPRRRGRVDEPGLQPCRLSQIRSQPRAGVADPTPPVARDGRPGTRRCTLHLESASCSGTCDPRQATSFQLREHFCISGPRSGRSTEAVRLGRSRGRSRPRSCVVRPLRAAHSVQVGVRGPLRWRPALQ